MKTFLSIFLISIYTFVAVDTTGTPVTIPQIKPETELEIQRYNSALRRKQLSLILLALNIPLLILVQEKSQIF